VSSIYLSRGAATGLDIYISTRASRTTAWGTPSLVAELSSAVADGAPNQTAPLVIMTDSDRMAPPLLDIYVATRASPTAAFDTPVAVAETDPWISPDGRTLYFTSNRDGTLRLWQTTR
jgi:hypothetical protein